MAYRSEIERALQEMISDEVGNKFQGIAVVRAQQKWPRLVACERKWDGGLDAHAGGDLEPDGRGVGLACSTTATVAEHAAFRSDRERLDKQISQATNPEVRRALEVRKKIEKSDYIALTSDRIAQQSYVITGNKGPNSEFDKFTKQAQHNREQATELRQEWRGLTQPEPERSQPANTSIAKPVSARDNRALNTYAALKNKTPGPAEDQAAELQKTQQLQRQRRRGPKM